MASSFTISKIAIIESIAINEVQTGTHLADYIQGLNLQYSPGLQICKITSGSELTKHLLELEQEAKAGAIPMIHFEMHGTSDARGLVSANLEVVPWSDISEILLRINLATRFNLVVFVAACNGGYFLEEMKLIAPTPCYALVAPTDEVDPSEIMRAARDFYRILLTTADATKAVSIIVNQRIGQGRWFAQWADIWYRTVAINYAKTYCTPKALKERAREMKALARAQQGVSLDMGLIKRKLKESTRLDLTGKYFDRFFCTETITENTHRFDFLRKTISHEIDQFLANPQVSKWKSDEE